MEKLNTATDVSMCLPPLRMALVPGYLSVMAPEKTRAGLSALLFPAPSCPHILSK